MLHDDQLHAITMLADRNKVQQEEEYMVSKYNKVYDENHLHHEQNHVLMQYFHRLNFKKQNKNNSPPWNIHLLE